LFFWSHLRNYIRSGYSVHYLWSKYPSLGHHPCSKKSPQRYSGVFQAELFQKEIFLKLTHLKRRILEYESPIRRSSSWHRWLVSQWVSWVKSWIVSWLVDCVSLTGRFVCVLRMYMGNFCAKILSLNNR